MVSTKIDNDGGEGNDLLGNVVGGLKFGVNLVKDTVDKRKQFFALKNGILYWYAKEGARKAIGNIIVKNIEGIAISIKNKQEISFLYQNKLYYLTSDASWEAQKWLNSLKFVKEMSNELNLDPNRY
jgi:hypothetical protein